jgi:hypothetical protein
VGDYHCDPFYDLACFSEVPTVEQIVLAPANVSSLFSLIKKLRERPPSTF